MDDSVFRAPRSGGRLRYGSLDDITSLDAHIGSSPAYDTFFHLFDRLTEYDLQQKPQPMLSEQWDIEDVELPARA
jgi:hypothetical protein